MKESRRERNEARWQEGQQEGNEGKRMMGGLTKALGWGELAV